ncbi:hypothetical protein VNO80_28617 [Phaseolus coccineus]|uniref:Uncharacterized protein n=1 Tax=Phaseolus coccineus TaxID=3886 RepID=A0AAN9L9X4_PHACN
MISVFLKDCALNLQQELICLGSFQQSYRMRVSIDVTRNDERNFFCRRLFLSESFSTFNTIRVFPHCKSRTFSRKASYIFQSIRNDPFHTSFPQ